jgi:hypothetical protein
LTLQLRGRIIIDRPQPVKIPKGSSAVSSQSSKPAADPRSTSTQFYEGAMTVTEIDSIEAYLREKWSL